MNILLLGGTGYLGKHLIPLLAKNNKIYVFVRDNQNIDLINNFDCNIKDNISICTMSNVNNAKYEWIINLAASYMRNGLYKVLQGNYVFPAGIVTLLQQNEKLSNILTIGTGLPDDFNFYSFCKNQFLDLCKFYNRQNTENIINVRLENFYGPDEPRNRFLPSVIEKLKCNEDVKLTEGFQHRDFIYIDDVVDGLMQVFSFYQDKKEGFADVPLGTGVAPTIREVVEFCKKECGSSSKLLFGAVPLRWNEPDSVADLHKLQEIGFKPKYDWQTGMRKMIKEFKL